MTFEKNSCAFSNYVIDTTALALVGVLGCLLNFSCGEKPISRHPPTLGCVSCCLSCVCIGVLAKKARMGPYIYGSFDHRQPSILSSSVCLFVHDSYISAISEIITNPSETCDGMAKKEMGESRLDILDSEINREWRSLY